METTPSYDNFFALIHKTELALNNFAQANSTELRDYSPTKVYAKTPPLIQTKYTATKNNTLVISQKCVKFFTLSFSLEHVPEKTPFHVLRITTTARTKQRSLGNTVQG